jgi:large subunit ribosomal protein L18
MNKTQKKLYHRMRRHNRIRARVFGVAEKPRLSVFRSARHISAQLINDDKQVTVVSASDHAITKGTKLERAKAGGKELATKAKAAKVTKVVFDRGGFLFAGRVKALADAAREGGLEF